MSRKFTSEKRHICYTYFYTLYVLHILPILFLETFW